METLEFNQKIEFKRDVETGFSLPIKSGEYGFIKNPRPDDKENNYWVSVKNSVPWLGVNYPNE